MLAKTESVAFVGTEARIVDVEVHVSSGVPKLTLVGLPTPSVREAEQRTRSALLSSDERWPPARMVANLAPGSLRKDGTHFDLPLALGILAGDERLDGGALDGWIVLGELALDGEVRQVRGTLAAAMASREFGRRGLICPRANAREALLVDGIEVIPVESLRECIDFLKGEWSPRPLEPDEPDVMLDLNDMQDVRGQGNAKEALEIAAAGGHNVLLSGSPGAGKTMLARRLPGILPSMSTEEALEVTRVYSLAGLLSENASLIDIRPFRCPHHHVSLAGLVGGGPGLARPGEVSLAHRGVLFLDELTLYRPQVLETLRAPLEEGVIRIARAGGMVSYPCEFSLIAAMNPCPCGFLGDRTHTCRCSEFRVQLYRSRISGPLLDRFDMRVALPRLSRNELLGEPSGEPSALIRRRVEMARARQHERYGKPGLTNASARVDLGRLHLTNDSRALLGHRIDSGELTGRGVIRAVRVAQTVADLAGRDVIDEEALTRALSFRHHTDAEVAA